MKKKNLFHFNKCLSPYSLYLFVFVTFIVNKTTLYFLIVPQNWNLEPTIIITVEIDRYDKIRTK